jgi:hypothetical protein
MSKSIPSFRTVDSIGIFQVSQLFGRTSYASSTCHLTCHRWCPVCVDTNIALRLQSIFTKVSVSNTKYLIAGCWLSKFLAEKKVACDQSHKGEGGGGQQGHLPQTFGLGGPQIYSYLILKLMSKQARMWEFHLI